MTGLAQTADDASAVADAVLYEGYLLYPYRHSSGKNKVRWQFGVLVPPHWGRANGLGSGGLSGAEESWWQQTECLLEGGARVDIRLRFLHVQHRTLRAPEGDDVADFDEALPCVVDLSVDPSALGPDGHRLDVVIPASQEDDESAGWNRRWAALSATLHVTVSAVAAPFPLRRVRVRVENTATEPAADAPRRECLRHSLVATHVILSVHKGRFISLLDPPAWASEAARGCRNQYVFPVLAGRAGTADLILAAPIILPDHPQVAPESPGDLHDATEIDEILTLRVLTLTDAERREARRTDPRAAAILDRVEATTPDGLANLHGTIRERPRERPRERATDGFGRGSRVRLRPRRRGTDAHDMFLAGRSAQVVDVLHDVDGTVFYAVTVDDDPGAELHQWYGRTRHFRRDELEPFDNAEAGTA